MDDCLDLDPDGAAPMNQEEPRSLNVQPKDPGIRADGGRAGAFQLLLVAAGAIGAALLRVNASSGSANLAMVATQKQRLHSGCSWN